MESVIASLLALALVTSCATEPPPTPVSPPPVAPAPSPPSRCRGGSGRPGIVVAAGRGALVVDPGLAGAYYGLSCRHPASEAFVPEESDLRALVERLEPALRSRGQALRDFHLQVLGVRLAGDGIEAGPYLYASGRCDAQPSDWMAPPRDGPCTFQALWRASATEIAIFDSEPPDTSCARPERTEGVDCRFGLSGYVLPLGRGTFVPDPSAAPEIHEFHSGFASATGYFQPDEESVRAAVSALETELATRPRPDSGPERTIADYHLQVVGLELEASRRRPAGRYLYVAGSCHCFGDRWLEGYLTGASDGGACFFDAYYEPIAGAFVYFQYHGTA